MENVILFPEPDCCTAHYTTNFSMNININMTTEYFYGENV